MIYRTPPISASLKARLDHLGDLRRSLGHEVERPGRWMGSLRREVQASSIQGSTSIEGYSVTPEEAAALVSGGAPADRDDENRMAIACYARAMDHVGAMAGDLGFRWLDRVILDLHFDACHFQPEKSPGLWRTGPIGVTGPDGSLAYQGPEGEQVPGLMAEIVDWLQAGSGDADADVVVRAAMAHLNVISVHPFQDGNGRVARIVQSLALAEKGLASPEFFSIEEYLGTHTADYYAAIEEVQGGRYRPERDASAWVAFCVEAHIAQAQQRLAQIKQAAARWQHLEELVARRGWPERLAIALEQSLIGGTERSKYGGEADISLATASADFRRLLDAGLVRQRGRGPNIRYEAAEDLRTAIAAATG